MSEPWRHKAACNGHDMSWWFPEKTGGRNPDTARAVAICRSCPVQANCLAFAQEQPEFHGIWGGLTPEQRRGLRRQVTIVHGTRQGYGAHVRYGQPPCEACNRVNSEIQAAQRRIPEPARTRHQIEEIS